MPVIVLAIAALALLVSSIADAGSATWSNTAGSGDWNTAGNWVPARVPNGLSDTAIFGSSKQTGISFSASVSINSVVFNAGASAYTITAAPSFQLIIGGEGIINNSGIEQNFKISSGEGIDGIVFFNTATAGSGNTFTNDGFLNFRDVATAGSCTFINNGLTRFDGAATAGNSTFVSNGNAADGNSMGGSIEFWSLTSAGDSTITVKGSSVVGGTAGVLSFYNQAKAGAATLIANGGVDGGLGGTIRFLMDSGNVGSTMAKVRVLGNGSLDVSVRSISEPRQVIIGSIEGDGNIFLGQQTLVMGLNSLDTIFSGVIQDGGIVPETGGDLIKVGTGTLTLTGANTYTGFTNVVGRLLINNSAGSGTGSGPVFVSGSVLGGTGTIGGPVTVSEAAVLLGGDPVAASGSLNLANNLTLNTGAIIQLVVGASGAHSTLRRTGGTWAFSSDQNFSFINLGAQPGPYDNIITGLAGDPGRTELWTITDPGFAGTFTYDGGGNIDLFLTDVPKLTTSSLGNISTRLKVETGDNVLIAGFIVTGTQPKKVILRAIGPSLPFADPLANPTLELRNSIGQSIDGNDNWRNEQEAEIIATGIPPSNDLESAIVATLAANNSAYTAIVGGVSDGTGIGVVELYDLDQTVDSKLANISTRGLVQTDDNVLIAGTIVLGQGSQRVLVRAIGPSLPVEGNLADPTLELRDRNGTLIRANDNWRSDQEAEVIATTIPPANDLESAIVATLPASGTAYTAIVRGVNNATGVALVEVYALN